MASLTKAGEKRWRIQFVSLDDRNKRKQIRLRGLNKKQAKDVFEHIESIIGAKLQRVKISDADAKWLGELPDIIHEKIVRAGLADPRPEPLVIDGSTSSDSIFTLDRLLTEHIDEGTTSKGRPASDNTKANWRATKNYLLKCFDADRDITTITLNDGHQFRQWLNNRRIGKKKDKPNGRPLAENAKRKHIENAKVFFNVAIRRGFITANPFEHLPSSTLSNRDRDFNVTREMTGKIIQACPDAQWRLLVALWRFAGLRKMEVMWLTWDDVLWDQGKLRVHAPKTAHHEGLDIRYVPLRDIRDPLWTVHEQVEPGTEKIITRFCGSNTNLDKPLKVILGRAGIVPWPKLFQNMRASCETDWLNEGHPAHVVAGWIGHSVKIQRANYAQITDGHFEAFNSREPAADFWLRFGYEPDRIGENDGEHRNTKATKKRMHANGDEPPRTSSTGGGTRTRTGFTPTGF